MLLNYLKTFSNKKLFFQSRHTTKRVLSTMTENDDYMPVLKYWFGVEDLSKIKSDKYTGNNLVIKSKHFFLIRRNPTYLTIS